MVAAKGRRLGRQPKRWTAGGRFGRIALNTWEVALAVGALAAFGVVALVMVQFGSTSTALWILWGVGLGALLFWVGSTVNNMMYRESSVRRFSAKES